MLASTSNDARIITFFMTLSVIVSIGVAIWVSMMAKGFRTREASAVGEASTENARQLRLSLMDLVRTINVITEDPAVPSGVNERLRSAALNANITLIHN